jgi:hypothetical protein
MPASLIFLAAAGDHSELTTVCRTASGALRAGPQTPDDLMYGAAFDESRPNVALRQVD